MVRRVYSLLLMLACVFAPVGPALAGMLAVDSDACCCATSCACAPMTGCAPAPSSSQRAAPSVGATVEQAANATKPAARVLRFVFAQALAFPAAHGAPTFSVPAPRDVAGVAASVALFQAHCSLRL